MKIVKIIVLASVLSISLTSSVFASWWNPTTWRVFSKEKKIIVPQKEVSEVAASTESTLLVCNGSKYSKCLENQKFICPDSGEDAYCETKKVEEIKTPKTKQVVIVSPATNKIIKIETASKSKVETSVASTQAKNNLNSNNNSGTSSTVVDKDSIYDINNIMDKDGNAIVITQVPNYKISKIVTATRGGVKGLFYKDKNTFFSEKELDDQVKASQDASDKEFSRGIYAKPSTDVFISPSDQAKQAAKNKQDKLDEVNLQIANLNAKYAENVKNVECLVTSDCINKKNSLQSRYIEDYNLLQAKFQQIKYGN